MIRVWKPIFLLDIHTWGLMNLCGSILEHFCCWCRLIVVVYKVDREIYLAYQMGYNPGDVEGIIV